MFQMTYTILVATTLTDEALQELLQAPDVAIIRATDPSQVRQGIADADALILRDEIQVDSKLLAEAKHLKVIGRAGVGLAGIDVEPPTSPAVIVMNTPAPNAIAAAEYTFTLMLALCRRVIPAHVDLQAGRWARTAHLGIELYGKTLGLIGLGRVGRHVAERAIAFGMEVLAYDPYVAETQVAELRVKLLCFEEVPRRSDVIS